MSEERKITYIISFGCKLKEVKMRKNIKSGRETGTLLAWHFPWCKENGLVQLIKILKCFGKKKVDNMIL